MFPNLGPLEMIVVMGVAVLLFGKRLPEVGRSLGKGIVEFKKGLRGIEEEFDFSSGGGSHGSSRRATEDRERPAVASDMTVPKFEPPTTAPVPQMEFEGQVAQD
jgi:sec-independent protein translocase protein TatA